MPDAGWYFLFPDTDGRERVFDHADDLDETGVRLLLEALEGDFGAKGKQVRAVRASEVDPVDVLRWERDCAETGLLDSPWQERMSAISVELWKYKRLLRQRREASRVARYVSIVANTHLGESERLVLYRTSDLADYEAAQLEEALTEEHEGSIIEAVFVDEVTDASPGERAARDKACADMRAKVPSLSERDLARKIIESAQLHESQIVGRRRDGGAQRGETDTIATGACPGGCAEPPTVLPRDGSGANAAEKQTDTRPRLMEFMWQWGRLVAELRAAWAIADQTAAQQDSTQHRNALEVWRDARDRTLNRLGYEHTTGLVGYVPGTNEFAAATRRYVPLSSALNAALAQLERRVMAECESRIAAQEPTTAPEPSSRPLSATKTEPGPTGCARPPTVVPRGESGANVAEMQVGNRALTAQHGGDARLAAIPALDTDSGEWLRVGAAAKKAHVQTSSLKTARGEGLKSADGLKGIDPRGRVWRKPSENAQTWYLKETL